VAKTNGRIDTLLVTEKQHVTHNQLLAIIENTANTEDIMWLDNAVRAVRANDYLPLRPLLQLGDLQPHYNTLQKSLSDYNYFLTTDYHNKKIATINKQIEVQKIILNQGNRQLKLQQEQLQLAELQFKRDSNLYVQKVIAQAEYETARATKLQSTQTYENTQTALENQKIGILQLEQSIFDLEQQRNDQLSQHEIAINIALDQLKASLTAFQKTYFLKSPTDGKITFTKYWQKNQNVSAGETILTVIPSDTTKIIGKIFLPPQGAGRVKTGQTVNVKFDNFPYMEYGMVKTTVKNIALVPFAEGENQFYVLEVDFPNNLTTNYNKTLLFSQQMSGTAEIITEDLRLIDRFLNPIKSVLKK
jgi:HlyD family secretion protein